MKKSDSITNLAIALAAAQSEFPVVPFDAKNPFFKSSYATLGAVISATRPILAKHGLCITQPPVSVADGVGVGIETMMLHISGEWIAETLTLPLVDEKGNSLVQVLGKDITYLRRYSWASFCGVYSDEDTDGNGSGNMPTQPQRQPAPARPAQAPKPTPAAAPAAPASTQRPILPRSGPIATEATRTWMLQELAGMEQDAWDYFAGNGSLMPEETLDKLPLEFVPTSREAMNALKEHIKAKFAAAEPPGLQEPPMDANGNGNGAEDDCNSPDAPWRTYPLPFAGKGGTVAKGTELAKLEKNYLFGLFKNIKAETEYNGKPLSKEQAAKSAEFRYMLDEAGRHYEFS